MPILRLPDLPPKPLPKIPSPPAKTRGDLSPPAKTRGDLAPPAKTGGDLTSKTPETAKTPDEIDLSNLSEDTKFSPDLNTDGISSKPLTKFVRKTYNFAKKNPKTFALIAGSGSLVAYMAATGKTPKDIANDTGTAVGDVLGTVAEELGGAVGGFFGEALGPIKWILIGLLVVGLIGFVIFLVMKFSGNQNSGYSDFNF